MTRRGQCRHENTSDKYGDATYDWHGNIVYEVEYRECLDCDAWLALGPSSDTPEVEIEIKAARIQTDYRMLGLILSCPDELLTSPAGWLARAIATHEESQ